MRLTAARRPPTSGPLRTIKVGIMPIPDCATVPIADMKGYFKAEGLKVKIETVQGGGVALPKLKSGQLDFAIMNYTAAVLSEANQPGTLRIVADAYQSAPPTPSSSWSARTRPSRAWAT
ncbi:ABC transporter substrate-binding protein [Nonomuraea ferruginea]